MVDSKKIGIAGAAVVLVTLVTLFGTSYMADFENNPRNVAQITHSKILNMLL